MTLCITRVIVTKFVTMFRFLSLFSQKWEIMIDTLHLTVSDFEVEGQGLTVQPSPYVWGSRDPFSDEDMAPQKLADFELFPGARGSKAYFNSGKYNLTIKPSIVNRFSSDSSDFFDVKCFISLSVPKFYHGNNYHSCTVEQFLEVMADLQSRVTSEVGVRCNLAEAKLSRIDAFRNVFCGESFESYIPVLSLLKYTRTDDRQYGKGTYLWLNNAQQFCVYDKIKEMRRHALDVDYTELYPNTMRFERRLIKSHKIEKQLGFKKAIDLYKNYGVVEENYISEVKKNFFKYEVEDVERELGKEIEKDLIYFKERYKRNWLQQFFESRALVSLALTCEVSTIHNAILNIENDRVKAHRVAKKLDKAFVEMSMRKKNKKTTLGHLYNELKGKVLKVA